MQNGPESNPPTLPVERTTGRDGDIPTKHLSLMRGREGNRILSNERSSLAMPQMSGSADASTSSEAIPVRAPGRPNSSANEISQRTKPAGAASNRRRAVRRGFGSKRIMPGIAPPSVVLPRQVEFNNGVPNQNL